MGLGLKHAEDAHHVYREQVRIAEWACADRPRHVLENRQIDQLWRAHFPKLEGERVQGELFRRRDGRKVLDFRTAKRRQRPSLRRMLLAC